MIIASGVPAATCGTRRVLASWNACNESRSCCWDRIKSVAEANECVPHMLQLLTTARKAGLRVFYAMHHRYRSGDYETWKYVAAEFIMFWCAAPHRWRTLRRT